MSRLEELIEELCPEGVAFLRVKDVARIKNGKDYKHLPSGPVPVYGSGGVMEHVSESVYTGPSVLIPRKGSLGRVFYVDEPFWNVDTIFYTVIDETKIEPRFLFHLLLNLHLDKLNQAGGVPSLTQTTLNTLSVPVPPLPVQQEIVRILDTFATLEAELEAELEARRQQYAWYRDHLIEDSGDELPWMPLGEVGEFFRGKRFTKENQVPDGIPAIHYGEIYTTYGISTQSAMTHLRPDIRSTLRFAAPGDVVIVGVGETVREVGQGVAWMGSGEVAIHDDSFSFRSAMVPEYVSHFLRSRPFNSQKEHLVSRGKMKRLSAKSLGGIRIPVPSRDEQERIASVLNGFDALVNDLSSGLPAEIAARRQQYVYYRDRLLTFKELPA